MTTDKTLDLYGVEDEVQDLIEEWKPTPEVPGHILTDLSTWANKRLGAIWFLSREADRLTYQFDQEAARLQRRRRELVGGLKDQISWLEDQLTAAHAALIHQEERAHQFRAADARDLGEEPPKPRLTTTLKLPNGDLKSKAGGAPKATVTDNDAAVAWLEANGMGSAVKVTKSVDRTALKALLNVDEEGNPTLLNAKGEPCPGIQITKAERSHWVKLDTITTFPDEEPTS